MPACVVGERARVGMVYILDGHAKALGHGARHIGRETDGITGRRLAAHEQKVGQVDHGRRTPVGANSARRSIEHSGIHSRNLSQYIAPWPDEQPKGFRRESTAGRPGARSRAGLQIERRARCDRRPVRIRRRLGGCAPVRRSACGCTSSRACDSLAIALAQSWHLSRCLHLPLSSSLSGISSAASSCHNGLQLTG